MRSGFGLRFWLALVAVTIAGFLMPAAASAAWSPIVSEPGYSGSRPNDLTRLVAADGSEFLYWHRDVGGFDTVQGMWIAANGTAGPILDISEPLADFGSDLNGVIAADGEVTIGWIGPGVPNDVVRSVDVALNGAPGPIVDRSPAGGVNEGVEQLSMAVTPNGTVAFVWRRLNGFFWRTQAVTVPDDGPAGTVRFYSAFPDTVDTPAIAALPDNRFKLAWVLYDVETELWNIPTIDLENTGAPVTPEPTYIFPRSDTQNGVDGEPGELNLGTDADGDGILIWRQFTTRQIVDLATGVVTTFEQWSAESSRFTSGSVPTTVTPVSPNGANISNINLQMTPDLRNTATWVSEKDGNTFTQVFRFAGGGTWNITSGPGFSDPTVSMGADGSMAVGWTDEGLLPDDAVARLAIISRLGAILSQTLPGLDDLKSSSEPLPDIGEQGLSSVRFYGLDSSDVGSFWTSSFSNPGITMDPPAVFFGTGLLNVDNGVRRVFVTNSGTTPTSVTAVNLAGADQDSFSIVNPSDCVGQIAPAATCEIRLTFNPDEAGPKSASIEVQSNAGDRTSQISGRAVARTRVGLRIKPGNRGVRPGKKVKFRAVLRNRGGITANNLRVCFNAPKRVFNPRKKCRRLNRLQAGTSRSLSFNTRVRRGSPTGRSFRASFRLKVGNANSRRNGAVVRVKRTGR